MLCVVLIFKEGIVVMVVNLSSSILFEYERVCSELGQGTTGCSGECCFGVIYTVSGMVIVNVLDCRLLRYVLTMVV